MVKKISEEGQHPEYLEGDGSTDRLGATVDPREEKQVTIPTGWLVHDRALQYYTQYGLIGTG